VSDTSSLVLTLIAGLLLGGLFFGGLWWTARGALASRSPALWFGTSVLVRTPIALGGFYFVSQGDWRRLLGCLCGFLLARLVIVRITRVRPDEASPLLRGGES
jgi:F1F0 ATPase subunit 2